MPRASTLVFVLFIALLSPSPAAFGGIVNIGFVSFDVFIPGDTSPGVNVFNIVNLTGDPLSGGFASPPDFPVMDPLTFLNSSLTLTNGGPPLVIALGDLGPGVLDPTDPVQFPDTSVFSSAVFAATLSQTSFLLSDGSTFVAASHNISAQLLPSSGSFLVPGIDLAVVTVSDVPEPRASLLLGTALAGLIWAARRQRQT